MLSNRTQHDMIAYNLVDLNQFGGICQWSTEDASLYLTHLVSTGWAQGLKASIIAFDITQFFPWYSYGNSLEARISATHGEFLCIISCRKVHVIHVEYLWVWSQTSRCQSGIGLCPVSCTLCSIYRAHHEAVQALGNQAWVHTLVLRW